MIGSVDLSPAHRAIVERILKEHVQQCEVRAFGSRVAWTAKDFSDLDLAVVDEGPLPWQTLSRLKEAFEESPLPMRVDVLDWHAISESFREVVERDYVVVQDRAAQTTAGEWRTALWGELATLEYGKSLRGYKSSKGPYRVYGTNGPIGWHSESICPHSSVIIGRKGAYRGVHYSPDPFFVIDTAFYLKPKLKLDTRWAYYQLLTQDINGMDSGSAIPSTSREDFYGLPVQVPPLPEQRAIAHVLGTLDDKIELNRRMNETLEEMARALFKSWFVDFDPVRAKAALKQHALGHNTVPDGEPSANGAPAGEWTVDRARSYLDAMDPQIADLFPDRLVDSEFGEIPEGWEVTALGELADLNSESWSRVKTPHAVEYVDLARTKWGLIEATQNFLWKDAPSRARRILRPGDTIVGTVRPGNGSYSFIGRDGLTGSTGFAVLRPRNRQFRELVYFAATAAENIERLAHRADGAAYPAVRPEVVADTKVAVPAVPDDEVLWFSVVVGPMLDRLESNKTEMHSLAAQRDALLPKLLAGQTPMPV